MLFHLKLKLLLWTVALILLNCSLTTGEIYFQNGLPHVKLSQDAVASGAVKLSRNGRPFSAFVGLPFATIEQRFAEPKLVNEPDWKGVKEFVNRGPMCPQLSFDPTKKLFEEEDCLNLNVYVPMNNTGNGKKGYPVMVWIHGGGFTIGGGFGYGASFFMDESVIYINVNYRLGVFGFLSTGDDVIPGNNGLKDQVAALKWVQQTIGKFGGDSNKVTIFGESAGAMSVHYLLLSRSTEGLFHRAISQSGGALTFGGYQPHPKKNAVDIATYLNCSAVSSSEEILDCLRGVSKDQLNLAQFMYQTMWPSGLPAMGFLPTAEPEVGPTSTHTPFLTKSPMALLTGSEKDLPPVEVPWMVGVTEDEGATMIIGMLLTNEKLIQELDSNWNEHALNMIAAGKYYSDKEVQKQVAEKLRKFYFGDKAVSFETADALVNMGTDGLILNAVYKGVKETVSKGKNKGPIYMYQYGYHGPLSLGKLFLPLRDEETQKVGHGDEVQHQFDLDDTLYPGVENAIKEDTPDAEFSRNFVRLWASFAKHGEPKHSWGTWSAEKWSPVSQSNLDNLPWYRIDSNPRTIENDPYKERMQFWDDLWRDHLGQQSENNRNKKTEL